MRRHYEQCLLKGCTERQRHEYPMCEGHCDALPLSLRNDLWQARGRGRESVEYRRAVSRALLWHTDAGKLYGSDG